MTGYHRVRRGKRVVPVRTMRSLWWKPVARVAADAGLMAFYQDRDKVEGQRAK